MRDVVYTLIVRQARIYFKTMHLYEVLHIYIQYNVQAFDVRSSFSYHILLYGNSSTHSQNFNYIFVIVSKCVVANQYERQKVM